jgi:hypothetical protein
VNPLKLKRERERERVRKDRRVGAKRKYYGVEVRGTLYLEGERA